MPDDEFKQKYRVDASNDNTKEYFYIISKAPKEDEIDTVLLFKLYEQQNSIHAKEASLIKSLIKQQEVSIKKLKTITEIMIAFTIVTILAAIIILTN